MDENEAMRLFQMQPSPDEVVAHERTKFLDVQMRALLQMRFPNALYTYNILLAMLNERPMQDMMYGAFMIIEEIFRRASLTPLDRQLHYKIVAELAHELIRQTNQPPPPPEDKDSPPPPPTPAPSMSEKPA